MLPPGARTGGNFSFFLTPFYVFQVSYGKYVLATKYYIFKWVVVSAGCCTCPPPSPGRVGGVLIPKTCEDVRLFLPLNGVHVIKVNCVKVEATRVSTDGRMGEQVRSVHTMKYSSDLKRKEMLTPLWT